MTLKKSTAVTILNGIVNPLFMCSFLPIVEGKPGLDFQAIGIAQFVGFLPLFGKAIETCVEFFGFDRNTPGARICGTVVGATLLFCIIGLFEVAFQSGVGVIDGVPFLSRWVRLVVGGWAFVVVGGLLFDPFVAAIAAKVTGE